MSIRGSRSALYLAAITALMVVLPSGRSGFESKGRPPGYWCAGVGLMGPVRSSADSAFKAWLAQGSSQPPVSLWHRGRTSRGENSGRRSVEYLTDASPRYESVSVGTGGLDAGGNTLGLDQWQATGACVR